jgi:Asp-tRNA(Asn)/Glu-tRNA(Gln) amidotransferase A subunit family amidase
LPSSRRQTASPACAARQKACWRGILVGIKDIFHADGFATHAGSRLPAEALTGPQGEAVTALRQAGALVVGKTVTTEFAYFAPGPTRNPHNPAHTPGGSSSGSAAAVAAGLCELALGTQTIGSINRPAAFCGVVGFKPTYDRIPRSGVIPLAQSLDHVGILAGSVGRAIPGAEALIRGWQPPANPARPVLAVPAGPYLDRADPEGQEHFWNIRVFLHEAGYEVIEVPVMDNFDEIYERHYLITAAEAARAHAARFGEYGSLYHPRTAELLRRGQGVSDGALARAREGQRAFRAAMQAVMSAEGVDAWVSPAAPGSAPAGLDNTGNPVMNLPWTQAGLPTLTLPAGKAANGLPLGLQLAGRWGGDECLLAHALELEQALVNFRFGSE